MVPIFWATLYKLDPQVLEMYWMCKYDLTSSDRQTDRQK